MNKHILTMMILLCIIQMNCIRSKTKISNIDTNIKIHSYVVDTVCDTVLQEEQLDLLQNTISIQELTDKIVSFDNSSFYGPYDYNSNINILVPKNNILTIQFYDFTKTNISSNMDTYCFGKFTWTKSDTTASYKLPLSEIYNTFGFRAYICVLFHGEKPICKFMIMNFIPSDIR